MAGQAPMVEVDERCPYALGAPIELADLLALPPDGRRYTRDHQGRLALMSPDDFNQHRGPLVVLVRRLHELLAGSAWVMHEGAVVFERVRDLRGRVLRPSFLGPRAIEPDIACFERRPAAVRGPHGLSFASAEGLRVVMEVLSPSTWQSDLGVGDADEVDKSRTYREAGIAEYWQLNPAVGDPACPLRPRSVRVLERDTTSGEWREIPPERGLTGSRALPALQLDVEAYWGECGL